MTDLTIWDIYKLILQRIWFIALTPFVVAIITAVLVFYVISPVYTAVASMYVLNKQNTESIINYSDLQSSGLLTADYRELILSRRVLSKVASDYGLDVETMRKDFNIEASSANNTRVIEISVTSVDPVLAANIANAIGEEFSVTVIEIMDANNVSFVDIAMPPLEPSAPKKLLTILIAGTLALILAIGISIAIELLDTTIRTSDDVNKALGLTTLACIPKYEAS